MRDAEVYHTTRLQTGLHLYGRWFHFVGKILKEPTGPAKLNNFTVDFIPTGALPRLSSKIIRSFRLRSRRKFPGC